MSYLLYASNEMYSSTHLIRKSKEIFDKLISNDIEKAVILRDGKPNFMLLEFSKYEKIMTEYMMLKDMFSSDNHINERKIIQDIKKEHIELELNLDSIKIKEEVAIEDINEDINEIELKEALKQIEALDTSEVKDKASAQIKEFWN